ncbi:MAG: hypothetical protein DCC71_12520 [Proteobacteria bacterium]|nr:MAG: hypothetical protein DCC71_12520 [Pseudomonadota bacterium]
MNADAARAAFASRPAWILLLALLFAAKLGVMLLGANRGLDVGDDGVFLFSLNEPALSPPLFEFYKLLGHLDPPPRFDFLDIRLLRIAAELAATLALALAAFGWARARFASVAASGFAPILLVALLGSLLGVGARGFGYNDATNVVLFAAGACLFRLLAEPRGARALAWSAAAGFAIGFQLFVKFPSALLLLGVAGCGVAWLPGAGWRGRAAIGAALLAGAAAAIGLFVLSNGGVAPLVAKWRDAQQLNRIAGYGVREILAVYYHHDNGSHVNGLRLWASVAAVFAAARWWLRGRPDAGDRALAVALAVGAAVLAWGSWTYHAVNVHPTLVFLFCLVVLLAPLSWALAFRVWRAPPADPSLRRDAALVPLLLPMALPVIAILGTNVALTLKLPGHVAPVFLVLAILLSELARAGYRRFAATSLGLLAVATSAAFVEHHVLRPYGLPSALYEQTLATPLLPELRVDAATKDFVEDVHRHLVEAGFEPGDPVIALDFMPGLVAAVGGRSPGFPFYAFDKAAQNCWAIERAALEEPPFLLLGQDMLLAQHACIRAFAFPEQFRLVAALRNPYEAAIRYFFGGPPMPYVRVFAPVARR